MIEQQILKEKFQAAHRGWQGAHTSFSYFLIYLAAAATCILIGWKVQALSWMTGTAPWWLLLAPIPIAAILAFALTRRIRQRRSVARTLETRLPDLNGLLLTAEGLLDKPDLNILEQRVISAATDHAASHDWTATLTRSQSRPLRWLMYFGLLLWVNAFLFMNHRWNQAHNPSQPNQIAVKENATPSPSPSALSVTLTPGDTEIERGSRLIIEATFAQDVPAEATLVVTEPDADASVRERIPMRLTIDGQVFGALITRVDKDARYHVEFASEKSQQHTITTFVYPALERADVKITPPEYTGLPSKEIKNTLKVTALEGSALDFTFKINKPVKEAELFGEDRTIIPLVPSPTDPTVLTARMKVDKSQKWRLHLVDDKERANKNPPWLSLKVQSNQLAKIEIVFPKRDIQVSSIQELPVEAKVWDDLGVTKSGVSFSLAGKSKEITFKHGITQPAKKQDVKELLALEHESAEPRQLVSYHFWAEDTGPQGEVRRSMSDMFFADVRHFEDIFREAEAPPPEPGMSEKKTDTDKLVELQKQIVNATWRIVRETSAGRTMETAAPDVEVVHESQALALDQTKEVMEKVEDVEIRTALTEAWKSMKDALDPLDQASSEKKRTPLNQALTFEQSALEWLHRAQSREHSVMRQKQPSPPGSASQQAKQNQLMNLELKQEEQRYEQEKQATPEQTAEQQENLQVLNRLKELARRQEALAEKMKELQKQIEKAETEQEKEQLANQLQRLQDEQEQLLRDVDDLKERMETSENATNMAEAKDQLEQTREQVMEAAEKLQEEKLADAANAATRAQRDLEQMQEDFKQKTAKRFSDEMKQVRQQAQEVAENQKQISDSLENQKTPDASSDTSNALEKMLDGSQVARQIEEQTTQVNDLLENMRRISEQAEGNNPLLHRRLYEAVRDAQTSGLEENLEKARLQSRYGNRLDAQEAERQATTSVEQLQKNVDKAAESVLGSETEALRLARSELDKLIQDIESEQTDQSADTPSARSADALVRNEQTQSPEKSADTPSARSADAPVRNQETQSSEGSVDTPVRNEAPGSTPSPSNSQQNQASTSEPNKEGQPGQSPQPGADSERSAGTLARNPESQQSIEQGAEGEGAKPGQSKSKGQGQGQQPGQTAQNEEGQQPGQGKSSNQSQRQPGQGQGQDQPNSPSTANRSNSNTGSDDRRRTLQPNASGGGADGGGAFFFDETAEHPDRSPLTGEGYDQWADRLRNVEELLNQPDLRNEAAKVLDNARAMRIDHKRNNQAPQSDHLSMRITQPLVELRNRVAEELAKRDTDNPMVPVDRDPVPPAFRDLVKRYYKELGNGN
ncbi:hypothetical protein EI77_02385 [Prosthecobacter fusiformis]|uniref:Uncharacterized protein n=1 Tax=Prosthecobacter fusiformis TaxID=48464 RepID=A0A4V3FFL1_9BACT|nr:hypothetical protein [Prosthecobacter fusiformis]TDU71263.1 hypothetical protein EI77_02385 [Prosthecobacter fusiformis]